MDSKEIRRIFYRDGYRIASQQLEEELCTENLLEALQILYRSVDDLLEAFLQRAKQEKNPAECNRGCNWCCHQAVFAVTFEFLHIQDYVNRSFAPEQRDKVLRRARSKTLHTHPLSLEEQLQFRAPCPFLESGFCMIYNVRPMACRIYLSSSVAACKSAHDNPGDDKFPELFEFPITAGRMMNEGFSAYLKQRGFKVVELPMEQGYSGMITMNQSLDSWVRDTLDSL
jgi:Fe-S-cluster containining protein